MTPHKKTYKRRVRVNRYKRKSRRTYKKYKGGFGSGVGANNYDPNDSIYNTRQLQLFPYWPNK